MKLIVEKLVLCLAMLISALLFMGHTPVPPEPPPSKVMWAQDGKHIIFTTPFQGVFVVDVAGRRFQRIPKHAPIGHTGNPGNFAPTLSPDGSRLAYVTYDKTDTLLQPGSGYGALPEDLALELLTLLKYNPEKTLNTAVLSAYALFDSKAAIETSLLDGTGVRRLTLDKDRDGDGSVDKHNEVDPVWSPDGSQIAFISDGGTSSGSESSGLESRLFIMNADGTGARALAPSVRLEARNSPRHHSGNRPPVWSPDGSWLAFVGRDEIVDGDQAGGHRYVLYTVRPDGTDLTRVYQTQEYGLLQWSPDSSLLAFVAPESEGDRDSSAVLYTGRPDGTGVTRIGNVPVASPIHDSHNVYVSLIDHQTLWSPDGAWLAFARADQEEPGVYVARPDGTDERLVVRGHGGPVSWSPDGAELFIAGMDFTVRVDGSGLRPFLADQSSDIARVKLTAWSPDGSRLAVLEVADERDLEVTLYTVARDGTDKRVLVRGMERRLIAEHSGWRESPQNTAACGDGFIVPHPEANPGLVEDCETLLGSRDTLVAFGYVNWSTDEPISTWDGVEVGCPSPLSFGGVTAWLGVAFWCPSPSRVIGLELHGIGGAIPPELEKVTGLKSLIFERSFFEGAIPPEMGNLSNLEELRIEFSYLDGTIPPQLGNLVNLRVLSLSFTERLSGDLPPELGKLSKLEELYLQFNQLSGDIPSEIGNLSRLRVLQLDYNALSGEIPVELGKLPALEVLALAYNDVQGDLPAALGDLSNLRELNLVGNSLTGTIPREFGDLGDLEEVYLSQNALSGSIPPELGQLTNLKALYISDNELTGSVPEALGNLSNLKVLVISRNSLSGCVPAALANHLLAVDFGGLDYCSN